MAPPTTAGPPPGYGTPARPLPFGPETERIEDVRRIVVLPGLGMLMSGVLSMIANLFTLHTFWALGPEGVAQKMEETNPAVTSMAMAQGYTPATMFYLSLFMGIVLLLISAGVVVGAMQMLRLRKYGLAVTGSILALVNIGNLCCLFTLPFGIWSLMVLRLPEVRNAFE
jgi:hypothetical protein